MPTWSETEHGLVAPYEYEEPTDADRLQEAAAQVAQFIDEAEELAWTALDHYAEHGPREQRAAVRARLISQSRIAFGRDPVAGAEAMHLANFTFSRGVPKPQAKEPKVQEIFDEAWDDPVNQEALTGFEAQRKLSNDLVTSANLFALGFAANGKFRVGFKPPEQVKEIVTDPEDANRALYYLTHHRRREWDFEQDQWKTPQIGEEPKKTYYAHWRNVDAYEEEAGERGEEITRPPQDKLGEGECYHVRINRVGQTQFGTPPWARTLRFYSGLNRLTEARIAMAQAAAAFIGKRVTKGGPAQVQKAAASVLRQAGDLAATLKSPEPTGPPLQPPPRAASIFNENEAHSLQPLSLNSGGPGAQADAQIVRAPLAAASGFGQHYLGDASNANLATATTLELPALMQVSAWQETFEQLYRWFCDRCLEEAVRSGRLGGATEAEPGAKPLAELRLSEAEDKREAEDRTGMDLSYGFQMPYPGRRNLPDVMQAVTGTIQTFDQGLQNRVLLKEVLIFLFSQGFGVEDPAGVAEAILEFELPPPPAAPPPEAPMPDEEEPMQPGAPGKPGQKAPRPADEKSVYGERRRGQPPKQAMAEQVEPGDVEAFIQEIDALWRQHVNVEHLADLAAANGNGAAP